SANVAQGGAGGAGESSQTPGAGGLARGGGVYCTGGATLSSNTFAGNSARGGGSGVAPDASARAGAGQGGAIFFGGGANTLTGSTLTSNSAVAAATGLTVRGTDGSGGAI